LELLELLELLEELVLELLLVLCMAA